MDSQNLRLALVRHVERHVAAAPFPPREDQGNVRILLVDRCKAWGCFFFEGSKLRLYRCPEKRSEVTCYTVVCISLNLKLRFGKPFGATRFQIRERFFECPKMHGMAPGHWCSMQAAYHQFEHLGLGCVAAGRCELTTSEVSGMGGSCEGINGESICKGTSEPAASTWKKTAS